MPKISINWNKLSLRTRILSALVYAVVLVTCILVHRQAYFIFILVVSNLCLFEFNRIVHYNSRMLFGISFAINSFSLLVFSEQYFPWQFAYLQHFWALIIPLVFIPFFIEMRRVALNPVENLGKLFLSVAYITVPFLFAILTPFAIQEYRGVYMYQIILGIFILIWTNDTFAFFSGVIFGKRKLIERISPKKTIEGLYGGVTCTLIVGFVLSLAFPVPGWGDWMAIALIVSVMGVVGDLVESMFKRFAGVKDSGTIMPGHGGILDRLDSFILSIPFIYAYLYLRFAFIYS